ncbi:MAG: hypothetical protein H0Z39_08210 [Peptococcaceae bacterium]|nr:hypothetical protein [Peptococcaceae bacterium]
MAIDRVPGASITPVQKVSQSQPARGPWAPQRPGVQPSFKDVLAGVQKRSLKISAHAQQRLQERRINLTPDDMAKIEQAVARAESKGARDSLLIYGDLALVTSIKNRTVVTAVNGPAMKEHVFTNIDSTIIIK